MIDAPIKTKWNTHTTTCPFKHPPYGHMLGFRTRRGGSSHCLHTNYYSHNTASIGPIVGGYYSYITMNAPIKKMQYLPQNMPIQKGFLHGHILGFRTRREGFSHYLHTYYHRNNMVYGGPMPGRTS